MKRIATLLTAGLIAVAGSVPAAAQTDVTPAETRPEQIERHRTDQALQRVKEHARQAVERRLEVLARLTEVVNENEHLTADHQADLLADYAAAEDGLTELNGQIQAATTLEEALALVPHIATDYRVFLVIAPKSHGVIVSDALVAAGDRIAGAGAQMQEAIDRASDAGIDTAEAQRLLAGALEDGMAAAAAAEPVAENIIGLDAADWPEPAQGELHDARDTLHEAAELAHQAGRGLRATVEALRDAIEHHET